MAATSGVKYNWIIDEENFIKRNFYSMTNRQLADALDLTLTVVRNKCYELGLKRINLQYWTPEQVEFLKANYKKIGDTELAEMFTERWKKPKGWTKKHIEKKRRYLKLKRTETQRKSVKARNIKKGRFKDCPVNAWKTRGQSEIGTLRVWVDSNGRERCYIKTEKGYKVYARWLWEKHHGKIKGKKVVRLKQNKIIPESIEDLEIVTRAENARRNKFGFDVLPEEMKTAIKLTNKIKKQL